MASVAERAPGARRPRVPAIRLEGVTKAYTGRVEPAVRDLSFDVAEGETAVLVGPSGCGKTTTLRLINRLITPDEGRIVVDGDDVSGAEPDALRRRMGYVIQQIGLFPHMTVQENVATVPRMLGWSKARRGERTDELLATVGLEPSAFRDRFPRELSGGQQQRVGVARALAADPPILLMDEPFGSVDPVVRERLQDELLSLQRRLRKTILFVTHDIDEAVKMGDRIAVMDHGGRIEQYATPAQVLSRPASQFVSEFVGPGATLKALSLTRVGDLEPAECPVLGLSSDPAAIRAAIRRAGTEDALLVDDAGRPRCWVTVEELERRFDALGEAAIAAEATVRRSDDLRLALERMVSTRAGKAVVVDDAGACIGVVELAGVIAAVESLRSHASVTARGREVRPLSPVSD